MEIVPSPRNVVEAREGCRDFYRPCEGARLHIVAITNTTTGMPKPVPTAYVQRGDADANAEEEKNVHEVYDLIAPHFSQTRFKVRCYKIFDVVLSRSAVAFNQQVHHFTSC